MIQPGFPQYHADPETFAFLLLVIKYGISTDDVFFKLLKNKDEIDYILTILNQKALQEIMNCKKNTSMLALLDYYHLWVLIACKMDTQSC